MTPLELRADIPALREGMYLNHGAHGPSPQYIVDAATLVEACVAAGTTIVTSPVKSPGFGRWSTGATTRQSTPVPVSYT